MTYSISELANAFALSRSTLIYYHKLGLLVPSARSDANYRRYNQNDFQRLEKIVAYRNTGMSLQAVAQLLAQTNTSKRAQILTQQIEQLNKEMQQLRKQQQATLALVQSEDLNQLPKVMNKHQWVQLLASIGMSDNDMNVWHQAFEQRMPQAHQEFLESLHISQQEISRIRKQARGESS